MDDTGFPLSLQAFRCYCATLAVAPRVEGVTVWLVPLTHQVIAVFPLLQLSFRLSDAGSARI